MIVGGGRAGSGPLCYYPPVQSAWRDLMRRPCAVLVVACLVVAVGAGAALLGAGADQKAQFRTGVTLVPVDIRVVDKQGRPITGLKAEDFTVYEDDVVQPIRQFTEINLTAEPASPGAKLTFRESALGITPQTNRVFLIVLGRGRLQEPAKGVDAVLHFIRNQLLPQDQVAVMIYDRATDFTTDHEAIATIVERFKRAHEQLDFEINLEVTSGLAAIYGSRAIPKKLQAKIDQLFEGSGAVAARPVTPRVPASVADDARTQGDVLQRLEQENFKRQANEAAGIPNATPWDTIDVMQTQMFTDLPFEEYIENNAKTLQDLGNCFAAVEYLRHVEGEKHLLFVTEKGMALPRTDDDEMLAKVANDAQVAIDVVQTGGIYVAQAGGQLVNSWSQTFAFQALRNISTWTGGVTSIMDPAQMGIDRIDQASRAGYVIGYTPSNDKFDGTYRKIAVKVRAPGANVLFRHGYYARLELQPFDRRTFITQDRILAALTFSRTLNDIKVKMDCALKPSEGGQGRDLVVELRIDPAKLAFRTTADNSHLGLIDVAVFWFDKNGQMLGNSIQRPELKIAPENWEAVKKDGIRYNVRFPVDAATRNLRVVVYDFKADLVGSVDGKVI
jgi:VWFA-related protein